MVSCSVSSCKSYSNKQNKEKDSVTYHRFPKKERLRSLWVQAIHRPTWVPNATSRICSAHFREEFFYVTPKGKRLLSSDALPYVPLNSEENDQMIEAMTVFDEPIMDHQLHHSLPSACNISHNIKDDSMLVVDKSQEYHLLQPVPLPGIHSSQHQAQHHHDHTMQDSKNNTYLNLEDENPDISQLKLELQMLRDKVKRKSQEITRLRRMNKRYKKRLDKKSIVVDEKPQFSKNDHLVLINDCEYGDLIKRLICHKKKLPVPREFTTSLRTFAFTLHHYSPKAYDYVRRYFDSCLPSLRSIRQWLKGADGMLGDDFTDLGNSLSHEVEHNMGHDAMVQSMGHSMHHMDSRIINGTDNSIGTT